MNNRLACDSANVQIVKAWITKGDGNWGFDEIHHMLLVYANGRRLHLSDFNPGSTFHEASAVLANSLNLEIDWQGPVWEEYQRYQRQHWWTRFLTGWHRNKLVVYNRTSEEGSIPFSQ